MQPKRESCISKETFVNVFICYSVSLVQIRKCDTLIHETSFGITPSEAKDKDGTFYNQITSGNFKTPLTTVTTMENLAIGNTAAPKRILSSKLKVNPNKTDKTDTDIR